MRAGLPEKEPEILAFWDEIDLFALQREQSKGRQKFILHDGPPYANGNIHIGTALNKILKDLINRSRQMEGFDAHYVPGWDCHGLPIEWKIEEQYRAKGQDKSSVPVLDFRAECRAFATHWLGVQREEFRRLGVIGDWQNPYSTMNFQSESRIAAEIGKFLLSGMLYRGQRPIMWSVVEQTALAEAELEYMDHKSPSITVSFPIKDSPNKALNGANILIWTTTPWTIPGNRAIACHPDMAYVLVEVTAVEADRPSHQGAKAGDRYLLADILLEETMQLAGVSDYQKQGSFAGKDLAGTICVHPWHNQGYDEDVQVLLADFVTSEQGTGFVHIAPGHGPDDWHLGQKHGIDAIPTVGLDGKFLPDVPLMEEAVIIDSDGNEGNANGQVMRHLVASGSLIYKKTYRHQYPHSWRSKAPLIFLTTPQWFIRMDRTPDGKPDTLRQMALSAIDQTQFYPARGKERLRGMIETRPDWCISRQRAWGVPIPVFVHKESGEILRDKVVLERIAEAFAKEGGDAWYSSSPSRFLGDSYTPEDYEQIMDVVDVWFDSGSTHAFCLEPRDDLAWPADLYLEGSDQHRGWFHSSLLESCGTRGRAPFKGVLTHGFVMAEDGRKMSKSLGNQIFPQDVIKESGADILRLWVVFADYAEDLRIGPSTVKQLGDYYRRFRNCLRWLLGNLANDTPGQIEQRKQAPPDYPLLERWLLHRMTMLDEKFRTALVTYDLGTIFRELLQFATVDLSAFYFDIRKDSLYCDAVMSPRRQASLDLLHHLFRFLTSWLAPVLCFTSEEAWQTYRQQTGNTGPQSIHLCLYPDLPDSWKDAEAYEQLESLRRVRSVVYGALEAARSNKDIGSSLEAAPVIYIAEDMKAIDLEKDHEILNELCITSSLQLERGDGPVDDASDAFRLASEPGIAVKFMKADGDKCPRCWTVHQDSKAGDTEKLCRRCQKALA